MSLLEVRNLSKTFDVRQGVFGAKRQIRAVDNVTFSIDPGEVVGLVGESGSGKTTIGKIVVGLHAPDSGRVFLDGKENFNQQSRAQLVQMIFQDPYASLNPKLSVGTTLREAINVKKHIIADDKDAEEIKDILHAVGMPIDILHDYPHQFSGGQRQRLVIARALLTGPKLVVADEPISALDISTGAQILKLLSDLKTRFGLSYLFISHDLPVVSEICDRILVMKSGEIVESGPTGQVLSEPKNSYTVNLLASVLAVPG